MALPQMILEDLILISTAFERVAQIQATDNSKIKHETSVEVSSSENGSERFAVYLEVDHIVKYDTENIVSAKVVYSGTFRKLGENTKEELDNFLNINAPAIIFPFVREVVASLTSKAMVGAILLQPVNFVKLYNKKKVGD